MAKKSDAKRKKIEKEIEAIRRKIMEFDLVCPGTLTERYNTCGNPNCRCARDPSARHGPYYDWTRREKGRFVHTLMSPAQADEIERAIANHKKVLELLAEWRRKSAQLILDKKRRK
ncbi:MAG: hypothetical protein DRP79_06780 [Planctomycetota bacterium]|nr:MAG: hypothetical protein DRP79_06780 [Planctomycetota bacterium]